MWSVETWTHPAVEDAAVATPRFTVLLPAIDGLVVIGPVGKVWVMRALVGGRLIAGKVAEGHPLNDSAVAASGVSAGGAMRVGDGSVAKTDQAPLMPSVQ